MALKEKYEYNRDAYTEAKTEFVMQHTVMARQSLKDKYNPNKGK